MPARTMLKLAGYILTALAVLGALWWAYTLVTASPKAEARLGRNTTEAAQQSGADAVNTVGEASDREAGSADLSRTNETSIRAAPGGADPVSAEARSAGLSALCKRAAYKDDPRCAR